MTGWPWWATSPAWSARSPAWSAWTPHLDATPLRDERDNTDGIERPVVANADQLVIVTALADPPPRPRMIDRMLVAAFDADIEPMLCLTKSDLASPDELVSLYAPLGVPYVVLQKGSTLDEIRERLRGRISVLVGTRILRVILQSLAAPSTVQDKEGPQEKPPPSALRSPDTQTEAPPHSRHKNAQTPPPTSSPSQRKTSPGGGGPLTSNFEFRIYKP